MIRFKFFVALFALLPIVTALVDIFTGVSAWKPIGVALSEAELGDPVLDSQVRFLATIWLGYGILLFVCLTDLEKYEAILRGALGIVVLGGVARVISVLSAGLPEDGAGVVFVVVALVIELGLIPLLLFWQASLMTGIRLERKLV